MLQTEGLERIAWAKGSPSFRCSDERYHSEGFQDAKALVRSLNAAGAASFQEEVSMLPAELLGVAPGHRVLDMCAAPGSKTLQLIEALHPTGDRRAGEGMLIANDSVRPRRRRACVRARAERRRQDARRVNNLLAGRLRKTESPVVAVTVSNAATFPFVYAAPGEPVLFDRVLADVPCSGDGTLRKDPSIWKRWRLADALELHRTQLRILKRGLALLEVGGRCVYSTCSLNPVENEAVVAAALQWARGTVALKPVAVPGLELTPGLTSWRVADPRGAAAMRWYATLDEVPQELRTPDRRGLAVRDTMFPPAAGGEALAGCVRLAPQRNDTGGFFCAVLERVSAPDWGGTEEAAPVFEAAPRPVQVPMFQRKQAFQALESAETAASLRQFYGLGGLEGTLFALTSEGKRDRTAVHVSAAMRRWIEAFAGSRPVGKPHPLRFSALGVRMFKSFDGKYCVGASCRWRPCQEGAALLASRCSRRRVQVPRALLERLLREGRLGVEELAMAEGGIGGLLLCAPDCELWLAAVIAGDVVECYASKEQVASALLLLGLRA